MRIISLNANGIRAAARKGFFSWLKKQKADVICIQETKAQEHQLDDEIFHPAGYHRYFHDALNDFFRLLATIDSHTTVTFFYFFMRPAGFITRNVCHLIGQLILLNLGLLYGENVRIHLMKQSKKILFYHSPQPVDVPGNELDPLLFFDHLYIPYP